MPSLLPAGEQCLTWRCTLQADDGIMTATAATAVANAGNATAP
jgi:hypothetical protein